MTLPISLASPPSRNAAPASYVTDMDSWLANDLQGLVNDINGLEAEDWFSVQSSPTDTTAGRLLKVGMTQWAGSTSDAVADAAGSAAFGFNADATDSPQALTAVANDGFGGLWSLERAAGRAHQIAQTRTNTR